MCLSTPACPYLFVCVCTTANCLVVFLSVCLSDPSFHQFSNLLLQVAPEAGQVVEVNERDRIGFTNVGNENPVALDLEIDDRATASTAHRTYFWLLYRDNYALPSVGESRLLDNNALRGRFSIGVLLDNG